MTAVTGPTITNQAARTAHQVVRALAARADAARDGSDGDWRNNDVRRAFLAVADHFTVTVQQPDPDRPHTRTIQAVAPHTHHGSVWAYLAADAMRRACSDGQIRQTDMHTYTLTITEV